ncbi:MAG: HD domain-containing protein [Acidobacteriota bacterium]
MSERSSLRSEIERARQAAERRFLADYEPSTALEQRTQVVDGIVHKVIDKHLCAQDEISFIAIGGYGRRQLYPHSDVDLLVLYQGRHREVREAQIKNVLQDLWDLRLRVAQQVWSWSDVRSLSLEHFQFILALLDGRSLGGDEGLAKRLLEEVLPAFVSRHREPLLEQISDSTRKRHRIFRDTICQLEPDLKQSPGGLRDHLVGLWIQRLRQDLPIRSGEEVRFACHFLSRLRVLLHFLTGRDRNRLSHRLQEQLAPRLGYGRSSTGTGVESLMKAYFIQARILYRFCRTSLQSVSHGSAGQVLPSELSLPPSLSSVLDLLLLSVRQGRNFSSQLGAAVVDALPALSRGLHPPTVGPRVLRLFRPRPGLYQTLSEMYELGVLEILFPEFGSIKGRVIRDFYHRYTVDEHSLMAIRCIEELLGEGKPIDSRFQSLLKETSRPEVLTLSLLLHDVGKCRGGKHVERGARMAARALARLQLDQTLIDSVLFLIRNHLAMSSVILRRNLGDRETINRFADRVAGVEPLRQLCLLTYADIKAVAPGALNEWKKDRLWQLYVATYNKLTLGYGEDRIDDRDMSLKLLSRLPPGLDTKGFEEFLEGFPRPYLHTTPPAEIYQHYQLGKALRPECPVQVRLCRRDTHLELCVVTPDRYHLFSRIVGLLSYFDMNILRGYAFSNRRDIVLDFFQFVDTRNLFQLNPREKDRFEELLRRAVRNEIAVGEMLEGRERRLIWRVEAPALEPSVHFEEANDDHSILEIVAPDSLGLLYRISREISRLECNIELVLISTEGKKAVDVFYLTREGHKLSPGTSRRLRENIIDVIRMRR